MLAKGRKRKASQISKPKQKPLVLMFTTRDPMTVLHDKNDSIDSIIEQLCLKFHQHANHDLFNESSLLQVLIKVHALLLKETLNPSESGFPESIYHLLAAMRFSKQDALKKIKGFIKKITALEPGHYQIMKNNTLYFTPRPNSKENTGFATLVCPNNISKRESINSQLHSAQEHKIKKSRILRPPCLLTARSHAIPKHTSLHTHRVTCPMLHHRSTSPDHSDSSEYSDASEHSDSSKHTAPSQHAAPSAPFPPFGTYFPPHFLPPFSPFYPFPLPPSPAFRAFPPSSIPFATSTTPPSSIPFASSTTPAPRRIPRSNR